MTEISYVDYRGEHILECRGHAGQAALGADILCSAISVLCLTAKEYLEGALSRGDISELYCDLAPGSATIRFTCHEESDALKCMDALLCGFKMLGESFPQNIDLDI